MSKSEKDEFFTYGSANIKKVYDLLILLNAQKKWIKRYYVKFENK